MGYQNFEAAIFCTVRDTETLATMADFDQKLAYVLKHIQLGKVYLETFRTGHWMDREKVLEVKRRFASRGIKTSGALTPNFVPGWDFQPSCYTQPEHRDELKRVVEFTAGLFDEIILDDFYFTNCRCAACVEAKGSRTWTEFRTQQLEEVSRNLVLGPAKKVNPKVQVIIKYPNWYDDYQSTGYNLADQPKLFDQIYTGTETRDPRHSQQTLQRYVGYFLMRYLEAVMPGKNGGGWFDTFDSLYDLSSYAEQCWLTLFAKAREVTLFCMGLLFRDRIFVPLAGYAMEAADAFLGQLGTPQGIACYKPYHSSGENYLHGYLGMLGLPLEPAPAFPAGSDLVLLTESARTDPDIVGRIEAQLLAGKEVAITSGLLAALQGRGMEEIAPVKPTGRKVAVQRFAAPIFECSFGNYWDATEPIEIPELAYPTNDCAPLLVGFGDQKAYPVLLQIRYGTGLLYVWTIPDDFGAIYRLPAPALEVIRKTLMKQFPVRVEGPAKIGLFAYDNRTFIVESFLPANSDLKILVRGEGLELVDLVTQEKLQGTDLAGNTEFTLKFRPASYRVFRHQPRTPAR